MLKVLTRKDVAEILQLSVRTIDYMVATNQIPYKRLGRFIRFSEKALERWMEEGEASESICNKREH